MNKEQLHPKYYASYSGVNLPQKLVGELENGVERRMTYFIGYFDDIAQLVRVEKIVYSEVEFDHVYEYDSEGAIQKAVVTVDGDEPRTMVFDVQGRPVEQG